MIKKITTKTVSEIELCDFCRREVIWDTNREGMRFSPFMFRKVEEKIACFDCIDDLIKTSDIRLFTPSSRENPVCSWCEIKRVEEPIFHRCKECTQESKTPPAVSSLIKWRKPNGNYTPRP